jgi:hypothetical protein
MGVLERLFGRSRAKVEPAKLGRGLAEIAAGAARPDLLEMLIKDVPGKNLGDAFLAMASLSLFAWTRASQNEPLRLGSQGSRQEIFDTMLASLVALYVQLFNPDADPGATDTFIATKSHSLLKVWNASHDKSPSPQWYVAKEAWFMLEETREHPDPVLITLLGGVLSNQTVTFVEFARRVEIREG